MNKELKIIAKGKPIRCEVIRVPLDLENVKTVKVQIVKKLYDQKYKRYYVKKYKRLVHYEGKEKLTKGQIVNIYNCRRISSCKSAVLLI